jgi:hypothetical protein
MKHCAHEKNPRGSGATQYGAKFPGYCKLPMQGNGSKIAPIRLCYCDLRTTTGYNFATLTSDYRVSGREAVMKRQEWIRSMLFIVVLLILSILVAQSRRNCEIPGSSWVPCIWGKPLKQPGNHTRHQI